MSPEQADPPDDGGLLAFAIRDIDANLREHQRREADESEWKRLAYVDSLTGLFNRRHFDTQLAARVGRETGRGDSDRVPLLLADVDYFKSYNDRYGHQADHHRLHPVALRIFQAPPTPV